MSIMRGIKIYTGSQPRSFPMIHGVKVTLLPQFPDIKGNVFRLIRKDTFDFSNLSEVYFSAINPLAIKAWKKHYRMTQNITVPAGKIRLVMFDARSNSSTFNTVQEIEIGHDNYCMVRIPPLVIYGFQCISAVPALLCNCVDMIHDPDEIERFDEDSTDIPYQWQVLCGEC